MDCLLSLSSVACGREEIHRAKVPPPLSVPLSNPKIPKGHGQMLPPIPHATAFLHWCEIMVMKDQLAVPAKLNRIIVHETDWYRAGSPSWDTSIKPHVLHQNETELLFQFFYLKATTLEHLFHSCTPRFHDVEALNFREPFPNRMRTPFQTSDGFRLLHKHGFSKNSVAAVIHGTKIRAVAGPICFINVLDLGFFEKRVDRWGRVTRSTVKVEDHLLLFARVESRNILFNYWLHNIVYEELQINFTLVRYEIHVRDASGTHSGSEHWLLGILLSPFSASTCRHFFSHLPIITVRYSTTIV